MIINHNISAMNSQRQLENTNFSQGKSLEKLSSGLRINRAADDAAGLAISETMRGQINGLNQASRNAQDGISLIQTAEGALNETQSILQRMNTLAVQAQNGTYSTSDLVNIQKEVDALNAEIANIANKTNFNGKNLLDGSLSTSGVGIQIGAGSGDTMSISMVTATATALGVQGLQITASTALASISAALGSVSAGRATLGAFQNRLEHTVNNLGTTGENLQAAESRVRDVDMAKEMMNFTRNNILIQAGTSMLAQANQSPQSVLSLLK